MGVNFEVKRKITVDGREYESLDEIPDELRAKVESALDAGAARKTTIYVNGKTYSSTEELPAALRAVVTGLTTLAMKRMAGTPTEPTPEAVRPEPLVSKKMLVIAIGLVALLFWIARLTR